MKKTTILLALALVIGALVGPSPARADEVPPDATWRQTWFPSQDGTMLHADVFLPKDRRVNDQHPVILSIGPYFGTNALNGSPGAESGPIMRFADMVEGGRIFERGYAYVQVDSRGYGGSEGCYDYGGAGEQMDAASAIEWAARQPWSNGKVGMWGKSYDAWTQVMALANRPSGLEAAVVQSPIDDGYKIAFMNGIHYDAGWYATPALYGAYDLAPPSATDSPPEEFLYPAKGTVTDPSCYVKHPVLSGVSYKREVPYWQERELSGQARLSKVPTFWSHGFLDANTKPDNFMDTWEGYRGWHRGWFGQYDHVRGNEVELVGRDGFLDEAMGFFDHFLKGKPLPKYPGKVEVQDGEGRWRTESAWPPADASYDRGSLKVLKGEYTDNSRNSASQGTGSWTFTQPAPYDVRFAGNPIVDVRVETIAPNANMVALLYDVDPSGKARLIDRGAYLMETGGRVTFELYPQDWILRAGHRIGILLSSNDSSWFSPIPTGQTVTIKGGKVELPFLRYLRTPNLSGGPAEAMGDVPQLTVDKSELKDRTAKADWPPRLGPR
ncbi:MAG: CocE/NonD family hydrolase [Actinomycetota bacterium]|nr:CocE/NonD family hydrolase [Actinomycetota bacterium]